MEPRLTLDVVLKVGHKYRTRDSQCIQLVSKTATGRYCGVIEGGTMSWRPDGRVWDVPPQGFDCDLDLVGDW